MSAPRSPSGDVGAPAVTPWRLLGVVALAFLARVVVGGQVHLTEDEAYYRLWALAPAFGYYDHPPMIAWWIWLGRALAGDGPLGVRLLPIASCALTSLIIYDLARLAGAEGRTAERAGLWYNAMLLVAAGGFLAVPDAPATLFWTASLWCVLKASRANSVRWWMAAGAAAGLATLSKYSALFLGPGVLIWLISSPAGRARLSTVGPWLALVAAAAIFAVNLAWNAEHHWLSFAKQFGRVAPGRWAPRYLAELVAGQFLLLNPFIALFVARALAGAAGTGRPDPRLFLTASAPFAGYLVIHSLHDRVQAHWPAPVFPALAVIAAFAAERAGEGRWWPRARAAVGPTAIGVVAALTIHLALPGRLIPLARDPALPVRGWPLFARRLEVLRIESGAAWIGSASYGLAAELADEPAIRAPIVQIAERARWRTLPMPPADLSRPGLIVDLPRRFDREALRRCFDRVEPIGALWRGPPGGIGTSYAVAWVAGPRRDVVGAGCRDEP